MANAERGEVDIVLGGESYVMAPTFQAMTEIQAGTGKNFVPFARAWLAGDIGFVDTAVVIAAGISAANKADGKPKANLNDVGQMLVKAGILSSDVLAPVKMFLENALQGGAKPGEAKAADRT